MQDSARYGRLIKEEAQRLGFSFCGFSKAEFLAEEAPRLESWLSRHMHGDMAYMERYFDKRLDPRLLVDGAKTVVSLLFNYYADLPEQDLKISRYALGTDYHFVLKDKLSALMAFINDQIGEVNGRAFVDSAPVLERAWAAKSGLGWAGKNGNIINKGSGSYFFISELIVDLALEPDGPVRDYCGTCTACIDACPTQAILPNREVNGSQCISYYTIELKDAFPQDLNADFSNWIFGCDICQEVCPWNRFSKKHNEPAFEASTQLMKMKKADWIEITEEVFRNLFKNSPVKRTKYNGLKRNIDYLIKKTGKL